MSVTLNWGPFSDTAVDAYHIFRSITGFVIPFPNALVPGAQLKFASTSPTLQMVILEDVDMASVIEEINDQAVGVVASAATSGPAAVIVRCKATVNPILKLLPCSALTQLGIDPELIGPMQNFVDIGTVPFVNNTPSYSFVDPDGSNLDWYYLKAVTNLVYSLPTIALQPILTPPAPCAIEGRVIDLMGNPVVGAEVSAQVAVPGTNKNNAGIVSGPITTLTDSFGRWTMTLPQCVMVQFLIPATGYNQVIVTPAIAAVLFSDLCPVNNDAWDPSGFSAGTPFLIQDGVLDSPYGGF